jgi:hypothetical protein
MFMLATFAFLFAISQEPVLQLLPADRTRVPPHVAEEYTLDQWRKQPESSLRARWREHRIYAQWERMELDWRQTIRDSNARLRAAGIEPDNPDPSEPTEPFWKRIRQMELKRDR